MLAAAGVGLLGAHAAVAAASAPATSTDAAAVAAAPITVASSTTTLPLFGAQLTVDLATGPGGSMASVTVNPADGLTATTVKPNKVVFVNDAGTAKVVVRSRGGSQEVEARAATLDDFVSGGGAGGWSGDVFGTGTTTTVAYTIVKLADGSPDITAISSSDTSAVIGAVEHSGEHDGQQASARIQFVNGAQSRSLRIEVAVSTGDDGASRAKVSVSLSRPKGVSLPADQIAGSHTWNGVLCGGSKASITYVVAADGTISGVTTTPDAQQAVDGNHLDVRFSDHERVKIKVKSHDDGQLAISVDDKIRCDSPDPSVNTPIATTTTVAGSDSSEGKGHGHGGHGHGHGGTDTSTPTSSAATGATTGSGNGNGSGNGSGHHGGSDSNDG